MSKSRKSQTVQYGIKEFDLSKARAGEADYELIQAPAINQISVLNSPDEAYLHFGTKQSPGLDVRDYKAFTRENSEPFGQLYLSNPAGSGVLRLLMGVDLTGDTEDTIGTLESIRDTVLVQEDTPLDVSGATVSVQEATPLDVSGATVPVNPNDGDSGSASGAALAGNGTVTVASLSAVGAESLHAQAKSTGSYDVILDWKNSAGTVIRSETLASSITGGNWTDVNQDAKAAYVDVVVADTSGASQTVDGTAHLG